MTIRVFASGQSNMLGSGTGGPALSGVSASVRVWNSVAPFGAVGSAYVTAAAAQAAGTFQFNDRNNLAAWFCDRLARTQFDTVDMVFAARNGSAINLWTPEATTNSMYSRCLAVWAAAGSQPANVFLWHQGESDLANANYRENFAAMIASLKAAGVLSPTCAVVVMGLVESSASPVQFNQNMLQGVCGPGVAYAPSLGLPTYDDMHFTGDGLYAMGSRRAFSAYLLARHR